MRFVAERQFIVATRETGYRTTSSALSELVDNSLQAGARRIDISTRHFNRPLAEGGGEIALLDDGSGMPPQMLPVALQFGGTDRFDDRNGLGRFGMGLPNSSVSQARRVDVYSWVRRAKVFHSFFDIDEIVSGTLTGVPEAKPATVPGWISTALPDSGTVVVWSKCDRVTVRRLDTFQDRIRTSLGRAFRYFLWDGVELSLNGSAVQPIDPLFCQLADEAHGRAAEIGQPLVYEIAPKDSAAPSKVTLRFSMLPVQRWSELSVDQKRSAGISKGAGLSVVRGRREISYGWHFMGQKRKENYDDWWRGEVCFDPTLDELFGVTHSKQGIRATAELEAVLVPEIEAIAHSLNRRVRHAFLDMKSADVKDAAKAAKSNDRFLSPLSRGVPLRTRSGGIDYKVATRSLPSKDFYKSSVSKGVVTLTINKKHPFFKVYSHIAPDSGPGDVRFAIDCLLLALARAEHSSSKPADREAMRNCFSSWSDNLAVFLRTHASNGR